jgi:hypothetical protein
VRHSRTLAHRTLQLIMAACTAGAVLCLAVAAVTLIRESGGSQVPTSRGPGSPDYRSLNKPQEAGRSAKGTRQHNGAPANARPPRGLVSAPGGQPIGARSAARGLHIGVPGAWCMAWSYSCALEPGRASPPGHSRRGHGHGQPPRHSRHGHGHAQPPGHRPHRHGHARSHGHRGRVRSPAHGHEPHGHAWGHRHAKTHGHAKSHGHVSRRPGAPGDSASAHKSRG